MKKMISLVMSLIMVVYLLPAPVTLAWAEGTVTDLGPKATESEQNEQELLTVPLLGTTAPDFSSWTKITGTTTITTSGNYYLDSDVNGNITLNSGATVTLDLNGHVLKGNSGSVISITNGTLTLKDSNPEAEHRFTSNTSYNPGEVDNTMSNPGRRYQWTWDEASGTEIIKGGIITGGTGTYNNIDGGGYGGGGVYVNGSSARFVLEAGNIAGNPAIDGPGGIECENGATLEIRGGTIQHNSGWCKGGGVRISNSTAIMTGGSIAYNSSVWTGGVCLPNDCNGKFILAGGSIEHNYSRNNGGGVTVGAGTSFVMEAGTIAYNEAGNLGGGVRIYQSNATIVGGSIEHNIAVVGGGFYGEGNITVGGTAIIDNNTLTGGATESNLYLPSGKTLTIGNGTNSLQYTGTSGQQNVPVPVAKDPQVASKTYMSIGVSLQTAPTSGNPVAFTTSNSGDYSNCFTIDNDLYYIYNDNNVIKLGSIGDSNAIIVETSVLKNTVQDAVEAAKNGQTIKLIKDTSSQNVVIDGTKNITLDLDGHTLTAAAVSTDTAIRVASGSSLVVTSESLATITGASGTTFRCFTIEQGAMATLCNIKVTGYFVIDDKGAGIYNDGILTMENCIVTKNVASKSTLEASHGGGIFNTGKATLNLMDCIIKRNFCSNEGGGINNNGTITSLRCRIEENTAFFGGGIWNKGKQFLMEDCAIVSNTSLEYGGGVCSESGANFYGCTFYYNHAASSGGAIYGADRFLIYGCDIQNNSADKDGGGLYVTGATGTKGQSTILWATITNNTAMEHGGGVYVKQGGYSDGGCFAAGTKILMADNSLKNIEDVQMNDEVTTFDHTTGKLSSEKVVFIHQGQELHESVTLYFTGDLELTVFGNHSLLEKSTRKYVCITPANAEMYIGKLFYNARSNQWETLLRTSVAQENEAYYGIVTAHHINCIANNMLSVVEEASALLNIYTLDVDLKLDQEQLQRDVSCYGLFPANNTYGFTADEYEHFNLQYVKVAFGKGLVTQKELHSTLSLLRACAPIQEKEEKVLTKANAAIVRLFSLITIAKGEDTPITCDTYADEELSAYDGLLILGSIVTIQKNKVGEEKRIENVYLEKGGRIHVINALENCCVGITLASETGVFTTDHVENAGISQFFFSDVDTYKVGYEANHLLVGEPCEVTFDSNGGFFSASPTVIVIAGTKVASPTNPEKDGNTFNGWYQGAELFDFDTRITTNTSLVASWTEVKTSTPTSTQTSTKTSTPTRSDGGGYPVFSGYTITSDLKVITKVTVDGAVVDARYYTVNGGNVTLIGSYIETLTTGKHTVKLYNGNGDKVAVATITVNNGTVKSSKTGDLGLILYAGLAVGSILGMGYVVNKKKE